LKTDKKQFFGSLIFPCSFVLLLWIIKSVEVVFNISFAQFGIYPRTEKGLIGIVTAPLIHASWDHLISNTLPFLIMGITVFYFYRSIALKIFFWIYFITDVWVWVAAREAYHIGASGLVYGFVCFVFFSGVFRKNKSLLALSLFVAFFYGSLVWGVFPMMPRISWESHLMGSFAGIITAYYFRHEGPSNEHYDFEDEDDDEPYEEPEFFEEEN